MFRPKEPDEPFFICHFSIPPHTQKPVFPKGGGRSSRSALPANVSFCYEKSARRDFFQELLTLRVGFENEFSYRPYGAQKTRRSFLRAVPGRSNAVLRSFLLLRKSPFIRSRTHRRRRRNVPNPHQRLCSTKKGVHRETHPGSEGSRCVTER